LATSQSGKDALRRLCYGPPGRRSTGKKQQRCHYRQGKDEYFLASWTQLPYPNAQTQKDSKAKAESRTAKSGARTAD